VSISSSVRASSMLAANPLLKGRHNPDFSSSFALSADDHRVLAMRGLSGDEQAKVEAIYASARDSVASGNGLEFLKSLDTDSLSLLQEAASLADPINTGNVSEEGAENLLLAPTEAVDLDRDGLIETGIGKGIQFPPVDASPELRQAWETTIANRDPGDVMTMTLQLAGPRVHIDDSTVTQTDVSADGFDWQSYVGRLLQGNEISRPYNSTETYQKTKSFLNDFLTNLRDVGLA
jgi:hypothetical protein